MKMPLNLVLIIVAVLLLVIAMSAFIVREGETALVFQFGEIVEPKEGHKPGLHFKIPMFQSVSKYDARLQTLDTQPERFLTAEKKNLQVDSFVRWRIADATTYFTKVAGDPGRANLRLDQIIKDGLRSEFSKRTVKEAVSGDRVQIMEILKSAASEQAKELGIKVEDVRIKRIDLPEEVSESVYARMRAERERVARDFRFRGQEAAERINADADRQRTVTLAEAFRDAETTRGEGDARAADIYARAYTSDAEFYRLYRTLNAYRASFNSSDDILVLKPKDSEFFRYFNQLKRSP